MRRPWLQMWRELNRQSSEPSSLMARAVTDLKRELSSPAALRKQLIADLGRRRSSPLAQAIAAPAKPGRLSLTQQAIADLARQSEDELVARVLGTPRPIAPAPAKRRKRPGRKPSVTPAQIELGIRVLRSQSRMTIDAARSTLREAGINAKDTALYELIIRPAYASHPIRK